MTDVLLTIFSAGFASVFLAERLNALALAAFGRGNFGISLVVCVVVMAACAAAVIKTRAMRLFGIRRLSVFLTLAVGVLIGFAGSGILGAGNMVSKIGAGILTGWYLMIILTALSKWSPKKTSVNKNLVIFLLGTTAIVNFIGAVYAAQSSEIYCWDSAIYWIFSREIAGGSLSQNFFADLYYSILHFDYNYLAALLSGAFAYLFGASRLVYILSILNLYYIPFAALCYALSRRSIRPVMTACILILTFPAALYMCLCGFVDIAGAVACIGCYLLYFSEKQSFSRSLMIGFLIVAAMLLRRWYAFFAVSFLIAAAADILISRRRPIYMLVMFFHAGFLLFMFFGGFVIEKLLADYGALYAGYKFALSIDFKLIFRYFGIIPLALIAAGAVWAAVKRDKRIYMIFIQIILCFAMFIRTQTHGQQHLLLYIPALVSLAVIALERIPAKALTAVLAAAAVLSANTLVDRPQPASLSEIKSYAAVPSFAMRPKTRGDVKQIFALKAYLDTLAEKGGKVGVIASSLLFNKDVLENAEMSFNIEDDAPDNYFIELPAVDSRDTDLSAFYEADYIVTADPVQTHLAPENQRVVTVPCQSFAEGVDIAEAFEMLEAEFKVGNIKVNIYKRVRENTEEEKRVFENKIMLT